MIQNSEYKETKTGKKGLVKSVYIVLMLMFYLGYVLLDNFRLNKSRQWITTNNLTEEDIQRFQELGTWTSTFESLFLGLFILANLILFIYRRKRKVLSHFIILNLCLFMAIFLIGYILSFFLPAPIGNLTQPLFLPTILFVILVIYAGFLWIKGQLSK